MLRTLLTATLLTALCSPVLYAVDLQLPPNPTVDAGSSHTLQRAELYVRRYEVRTSGQFAHAICYADFDEDGDVDVFTSGGDGSPNPAPAQIFLNNGLDQFAADPTFFGGAPPGQIHPRKALLGDFNGDGKHDVFVAGHGFDQPPFPGEAPYCILSTPSGFKLATGLDGFIGFHHGAASADLDADGDLDVFVASNSQPFILYNDGAGNFTRNVTQLSGIDGFNVFTAELVDVDADGFIDLLLAGHEQDGFPSQILWGSSTGSYGTGNRSLIPAVPQRGTVVDIDVADLDGDGKKDLVLNRTGDNTGENPIGFYNGFHLQVLKSQGNRSFVDATATMLVGGSSVQDDWFDWLRIQDLDGDGKLDLFADDAARDLAWFGNGSTFVRAPATPAAPDDVSASYETFYDRVQVTWSSVASVTGYDVYRIDWVNDERIRLATNLAGTTFNDFTAVPETEYLYYVTARRGLATDYYSGNEAYGLRALAPPDAPDGLTATTTKTNGITVQWQPAPRALYYDLYRHTSDDVDAATLAYSYLSETSVLVTNTPIGVPQYFWLKAINNTGESAFSAPIIGIRKQPPPATPSFFDATTDAFSDRIRLIWSTNSSVDSYSIYRSESPTTRYPQQIAAGLTASPHDDLDARPGVPTFYWLRAHNAGGISPLGNPAEGRQLIPNDSDGDQLPDDWELANNLDPTVTADAAADVDGDGLSSRQEYLANSDPNRYVLTLTRGWNLVSISRQPTDNRVEAIFDVATVDAVFQFDGRRLVRATHVTPLRGYWLHAKANTEVEIPLP